jgi:hypothetical protein
MQSIQEHMDLHLGGDGYVLHETTSSLPHIDVNIACPTAERPFFALVTSGMSDLTMQVPKGLECLSWAELCLCLPSHWPLAQGDLRWREPNWFWPIGALRRCALYPHENKTWLALGHSLNLSESDKLAGGFAGLGILPPRELSASFREIKIAADKSIHILTIYPLFAQELSFKEKHGSEKLLNCLNASGVTEVFDPARQSACSDNKSGSFLQRIRNWL